MEVLQMRRDINLIAKSSCLNDYMDYHCKRNVLNAKDCQNIIKCASCNYGNGIEKVFERSPIYNKKTKKEEINVSKRDSVYVELPFTTFAKFVPKIQNSFGNLLRHTKLIQKPRLICYQQGGKFDLHRDMVFKEKYDGKCYKGKYNMIIYLNENYGGGETTFFDEKKKQFFQIKGGIGDILLFNPEMLHCGEKVNGTKYIILVQLFEQVPNKINFIRGVTNHHRSVVHRHKYHLSKNPQIHHF